MLSYSRLKISPVYKVLNFEQCCRSEFAEIVLSIYRFGYLEFPSEEIAAKVMTELQNSTLCGRAVCLDYVGDKRQNTTPQQQPG